VLKLIAFLQTWFAAREDEDRGATMVEYGIMVALIAVVVLAAVGPLGEAIADLFDEITGAL
jgi:pilus assembly protein Flp/PilA